MRILMVNYEYPPLGGGGGVMAAALSRGLVQEGHQVDYVTTHFAGLQRQEILDGVRIFREPVPGRKDLHTATIVSMLLFPPVAWWRGSRLAQGKQSTYDLVHTHFAIPSGPGGWLLSHSLRIPNVLSVYGGDIYDPSKSYSPHRHPVLRQVVRRVLNQASVVIGESDDICRRTRDIYRPTTPVHRIPLGFEPHPYTPLSRTELGLRDDRVYAITVSRLIPRKRHADLLRAFQKADAPNLNLLLVGDGPEEPALRDLARELGLAERIVFAGAVTDERKYQLLAVSDFFALISDHEGFGLVFLEAMHCGLPVLAGSIGGQTDFLREEENALLVTPRQTQAISQALDRLANNQTLRGQMGEQNLRIAAAHSMPLITRQYVEAYRSVLRRSESSATA